jgi:crossover junction endodeoxyribonuclease RusA
MMELRLTITLPLPPRELNPNARCHWAKKAKAVKEYRRRAWALARKAMRTPPRWKEAEARAVFYWPDRRRRDRDNAQASLKAAWDGITDAGMLEDDSGLTHRPCGWHVDRKNPRVELTITPTRAESIARVDTPEEA